MDLYSRLLIKQISTDLKLKIKLKWLTRYIVLTNKVQTNYFYLKLQHLQILFFTLLTQIIQNEGLLKLKLNKKKDYYSKIKSKKR